MKIAAFHYKEYINQCISSHWDETPSNVHPGCTFSPPHGGWRKNATAKSEIDELNRWHLPGSAPHNSIHQMIRAWAVRQMQFGTSEILWNFPFQMDCRKILQRTATCIFLIGVQHLQWNLIESHSVWSLSLLMFWKLGAMETGPVWRKINSIRWTSSVIQCLLEEFVSNLPLEWWRMIQYNMIQPCWELTLGQQREWSNSWKRRNAWWSSIFTTFRWTTLKAISENHSFLLKIKYT